MNLPPINQFLYLIPAAFLAPIIHEWVRARVSAALGDTMPFNRGFITWNPLKFFEPIGFVLTMAFHIGWARPATTSNMYYKDRRAGTIITCVAPVVVNLLLGMVAAFAINFIPLTQVGFHASMFLARFAQVSISIAIVNLIIPVYPFGANALLKMFVSPEVVARMNHYEKPMQILMMIMIAIQIIPGIVNPIRGIILGLVMM